MAATTASTMAGSGAVANADERTAIKSSFDHSDGLNTGKDSYFLGIFGKISALMGLIPKRYVVALMAFFGFCNVYTLRVNLSVAIVDMVKNHTDRFFTLNHTTFTLSPRADFEWDKRSQGVILSSFFYGYIITQVPGGWLANKLGGKLLFGFGVLLTALLTLLTPVCAKASMGLLIALRVMEGLCEGVTYPSILALWSVWAPPLERSKLATIAFSGSYIGTVFTMPIAGLLAEHVGWSSVFYVFGFMAMLWCALWFWLVTESPNQHTTITNEELEYIQGSIGFNKQQVQVLDIPWKHLLTSPPVWAIAGVHFAQNWGFYTLLTSLPTFLNNVFGFTLDAAGTLAALPYLVMAVLILMGGQMSDWLRRTGYLSTTHVRKLLTITAFSLQVLFMLVAGYVMTADAAVSCLTIAIGSGGLAWAAFSVNPLDIAPQYASVLMGLSNCLATVPGILSPVLTGFIVDGAASGGKSDWQTVFYIAAGVYCLGLLVYALFGSGERQPWAQIQDSYVPCEDEVGVAEADTATHTSYQ